MYIRVTQTVKSRGVLIRPEELQSTITDSSMDWYRSPFEYGEDALEYWNTHEHSIKGYQGKVTTDILYWDLDCKGDFNRVRKNAIKLLEYIATLGYGAGLEVYFSGNKGVHVLLKTKNTFTHLETSAICFNIAKQAGMDTEVFDESVYNVNRIFRIANTRHQESGLYKILLTDEEVGNVSEEQIRTYAEAPRDVQSIADAVDAEALKEKFIIKQVIPTSTQNQSNVIALRTLLESADIDESAEFNPLNCPRGKRRCIYVLENGRFGSGERENALIRIAAYYKGKNYSYEQTYAVMIKALDIRSKIYPEVEPAKDEDTHRILKEVYSEEWKGGTYSCRSTSQNPDHFLQHKCDLGEGPCGDEYAPSAPQNVVNIETLIGQYMEYGDEALKEYPKTGLAWLDKKVRIRPRNYSIINGANGSGKTSLVTNLIRSLNEQKIFHIVFSLDMADTSLFEKLGATFTEYSQVQIEEAFNVNSRNLNIMKTVATSLRDALPYTLFDFTSSADSKHLESAIHKMKKTLGIDIRVGFVDYAGRLTGEHDNEYANATANALSANDISKRTSTHMIYLSQVSRENGDHTTPLRSSRVSKSSGAWEENATFILNVWRPFGNGLDGDDSYMHVYIAKNRSGALGEHVFWWDGQRGQIREMDAEEFDKYKQQCAANDMEPPYEQNTDLNKNKINPKRKALDLLSDSRFEGKIEGKVEGLNTNEPKIVPVTQKSTRFRPNS